MMKSGRGGSPRVLLPIALPALFFMALHFARLCFAALISALVVLDSAR